MLVSAVRIGDGEAKATGRWRLNSGSEMMLQVPALGKKPVRVVIDLATAKFKGERVVALYNHGDNSVVGYWDRADCSSVGVEADLHLMEPKSEMEADVLAEAVMVGAMARSGVPVQVSVGASPGPEGEYVPVSQEETVKLNGREYCGAGDSPLYILKGALIDEGSIVTFGADSETGRIAATRHLSPVKKETTMSDSLKALLGKFPEKHHGLVARCVAENLDEAAISNKIQASELADKDAEITSLKAKITELETGLTDAKGKLTAALDKQKSDKVKAAAGGADGVEHVDTEGKDDPKTLTAAMESMIKAGCKERGFALRAAALTKYPNVERK